MYEEKGQVRFEKVKLPKEFYSESYAEVIWDIEKENEDMFWLATSFGLVRAQLNGSTWTYEQYLAGSNLRKVFIDDYGNIWAGGYRGLYLITLENREDMNAYQVGSSDDQLNGFRNKVITDIFLDRGNHL